MPGAAANCFALSEICGDVIAAGSFEMQAPSAWRDHFGQPQDDIPPTIAFAPKSGAPFQVMITPMWSADSNTPLPDE